MCGNARKSRCWPAVMALGFGLFLAPMTGRADYTATPRADATWGVWEGWGTSLCWWANVFGNRDDLANLFFTTNTTSFNGQMLPGLGLNIARYNAGACTTNSIDGQTMQVSPNIPTFRQMQGFWLKWFSADPGSASWDWSKDANQRAMLQKAKARGANLFELFSNSPLWWMCYNHNPSGGADGGKDNLQSWNYSGHAVYLATIARRAADQWGITFDSVEPFNEPSANWWTATGTQEGCHIGTAAQALVIEHLATELVARSLTQTVIAASDETSYDAATATWSSFSAATKGRIGRVNVHGYQYGGGRRDLLYSAVAGKKLWNSEYGESDGTGISLARNLNLDFRWLHMTAWCYWQVLDSGGWGLIQSNPGDRWIGPANPKYYVLAHYTRHIRPGMVILDSGNENTVVAYDTNAHKLVLVTMNYETPQTVRYDLGSFFGAGGPVRRWVTATASGAKYASYTDVALSNRTFSANFGTNMIQTFEVQNVYATGESPPLRIAKASEEWVISWPSWAEAFRLHRKAATLSGAGWEPVTNAVQVGNGTVSVRVASADEVRCFFRLQYP